MTTESFSDQPPASGSNVHASTATHSAAGSPEAFPAGNESSGGSEREQQMLEVAGRIGGVLGTAVRHARGFSGRVRGGLQLVRGQVTNTVARASQETSGAASQFTETAREEAAGWSQAVRQKAGEFRQQARGIKTEYPLQMILGLALVSFVIGFGIRIWRSTRG